MDTHSLRLYLNKICLYCPKSVRRIFAIIVSGSGLVSVPILCDFYVSNSHCFFLLLVCNRVRKDQTRIDLSIEHVIDGSIKIYFILYSGSVNHLNNKVLNCLTKI